MSRISANHVINVSSDGVMQNDEENETKKILSYDGTDPTNGEKMTVRADGFTKVQRLKETIFQFPDGTRVTKSDNDVQIEKPGLPCVLFEENCCPSQAQIGVHGRFRNHLILGLPFHLPGSHVE